MDNTVLHAQLVVSYKPYAAAPQILSLSAKALNMLSSLIMVRMGRVHDGLMVDMQACNAKLRGRAERMVVQIIGCDIELARSALAQTGGRVKTAVLVVRGLTPQMAEAALASHGNSLRAALAALPE